MTHPKPALPPRDELPWVVKQSLDDKWQPILIEGIVRTEFLFWTKVLPIRSQTDGGPIEDIRGARPFWTFTHTLGRFRLEQA